MKFAAIVASMNVFAGNRIRHELSRDGSAIIISAKNGGPQIKLSLEYGENIAFACYRRADVRCSPWRPIELGKSSKGILRHYRKVVAGSKAA